MHLVWTFFKAMDAHVAAVDGNNAYAIKKFPSSEKYALMVSKGKDDPFAPASEANRFVQFIKDGQPCTFDDVISAKMFVSDLVFNRTKK